MLRLTFRRVPKLWNQTIDVEQLPDRFAHIDEPTSGWSEILDGLGRRQKACVALVEVWGFSSEEAGRILGCSSATVRSQVFRALRTLRAIHEEER